MVGRKGVEGCSARKLAKKSHLMEQLEHTIRQACWKFPEMRLVNLLTFCLNPLASPFHLFRPFLLHTNELSNYVGSIWQKALSFKNKSYRTRDNSLADLKQKIVSIKKRCFPIISNLKRSLVSYHKYNVVIKVTNPPANFR